MRTALVTFQVGIALFLVFAANTQAFESPSFTPLRDARQISLGGFACARLASGKVLCWGRISPKSQRPNPIPTFVQVERTRHGEKLKLEDLEGVSQVAVGLFHACALVPTGNLGGIYCWGQNTRGQLGLGDTHNRPHAVRVEKIHGNDVLELAAGDNHTCARLSNGMINCWGSEGIGVDLTEVTVPTAVTIPGVVSEIVAGGGHSCARTKANEIFCWGRNTSGQLGHGNLSRAPEPVRVVLDATRPFGNPIHLTAGGNHSCAIFKKPNESDPNSKGVPFCWGKNSSGQLGTRVKNDAKVSLDWSATPVRVQFIDGNAAFAALTISAGNNFTCGTFETPRGAQVFCWGDNTHGQMGDRTHSSSFAAVPISLATDRVTLSGAGFNVLSSGLNFACAIADDHWLHCWGFNGYGELANASIQENYPAPVLATRSSQPLTNAIDLAVGADFACSALKAGTVVCWGSNSNGSLGIGTTGGSQFPRKVLQRNSVSFDLEPLDASNHVAAGRGHACAITRKTKTVYCWGANDHGQLGNSTSQNQNFASPVIRKDNGTRLDDVRQIYAGEDTTCAVTGDDRTLYCWGDLNRERGVNENRAVAIQDGSRAGPFRETEQVQAGSSTCVRRFGKALCFGRNLEGNLGNGTHRPDLSEWDSGESKKLNIDSFSYFATPFNVMTRFNFTPWKGISHAGHWWHIPTNTHERVSSPWATTADSQVASVKQLGVGSGGQHCAVLIDKRVLCWNWNPKIYVAQPPQECPELNLSGECTGKLRDLQGVQILGQGDGFACAYGHASLSCWGNNQFAQVSESRQSSLRFATLSKSLDSRELAGIEQLVGGGRSICARLKAGRIACWGQPLGNETVSPEPTHRASFVLMADDTH